jgi:hypothetical protein
MTKNTLSIVLHEPIELLEKSFPGIPMLMLAWKIAPALATGCKLLNQLNKHQQV